MALHEHRIVSVKPMDDYIVECRFEDGTLRTYDMKSFAERYPFYKKVVSDPDYFNRVSVILGGDAIAWDDMRDLSSEGIFAGI